jgi:hypothetical protein
MKAFMLVLSLAVLMMSSVVVGAEDGACKQDVKKLCTDVGPAKLKECIKQKSSELSAKCKQNAQTLKAKSIAAIQGCKEDVAKFCASAEGFKAQRKCLKDRYSELTVGCKAQIGAGIPSFR